MIQGLIIFSLVYLCTWIYRRHFATMITEQVWIEQLTVYHDAETYSLEERKKAEQFLCFHEALLKARGIRYMTNEEFLAWKNQNPIPAGEATSNGQAGNTSFIEHETPCQSGNTRLQPPLARNHPGPITISQHGQTFGPYDLAGVVNMWDAGQLAGNSSYWHEQLADWRPLAHDIGALRMMLA